MSKASIVIGLGFGDEGKGLITDFLVRETDAKWVVRFNGGCQAGHTVMRPEGTRHVFSHFGSGTLAGAKTLWSHFCPISPEALVAEGKALETLMDVTGGWHWQDNIAFSAFCPVTTWYDIAANQALETQRGTARHGSVGAGFGATIERHDTTAYKLYARDLACPELLVHKLAQIRDYYERKIGVENLALHLPEGRIADLDEQWVELVTNLHFEDMISPTQGLLPGNAVFEGAQGTLLDQDRGIFPHVTRSNTTAKNALAMLQPGVQPDIYYLARTYLTKHGAGPMPGEEAIQLRNNANETNVPNPWQGNFRVGRWSRSLVKYAVSVNNDEIHRSGVVPNTRTLVTTCHDQHTEEGNPFDWVLNRRIMSYGPYAELVRRV